jgi:hypothetical protein
MREGDMVRVDLDVQSATILIRREACNQNAMTAKSRRRRHV